MILQSYHECVIMSVYILSFFFFVIVLIFEKKMLYSDMKEPETMNIYSKYLYVTMQFHRMSFCR